MNEKEHCIYCNQPITECDKRYRIHLKNESLKDVYCCSKECFQETKKFMEKDDKNRMKLYIILAVCIVIDLLLMTFFKDNRFMYIPLGIMGLALYFWPYIIIRYRSYQRLGIVKTLSNLKKAGFILVVLSVVFFIFVS